MYLQYFFTIFASFLILIKSEDVMPPSGRSYYQLQHQNKGKLTFTLNFLTFSSSYRDSSLVFVVGSEKHCMFQLKLVSNVNSAIILLKKYGDYEGEEKRVEFKDVDEKVEVSYFDDKFFLNQTEVLMKCGVEWMPLDRKTDMIDILIDNAEANPAYVNIVWGDYIKYYDPNPNSTEPEETTANSENPTSTSTKKVIATTTPKLTITTPKKTEETADASVGLIVGISVGGFIFEDVMPPSGRSYYQLQHPNKGKLSFTLNFLTFSSEEKRVDLKDVDEKVEVSYFNDKFFLNETEVLMKCGVEWMPLDKKTDMIDILIDNAEANPAYVNIVWGDYIKYYDPNPNSTEPEETTANSENSTSTKKFIATTTPKLTITTPKKTEETADASVGLIVGISIGGFILGCIIGVGSIVAYLYFMKKQSKSKSNVKTVVTSKSITAPLRQDELDAK
uniref:Uncharacterized protein n=1 Tax=Panagrolaimus sp. ES5 TaxID=591445 RepID=A0AC34F7V8_9BILA